jgi:sec-independent protein translocase protein TatB
MLPEAGALELLLVAAVALIVVGPKDLPILFRKLGQFVSKMRGLASEFRASFDELARQSELDELRKEVEALRLNQPLSAPSVAHEFEADFQNFQRSLEAQPTDPTAPVNDPHEPYQPPETTAEAAPAEAAKPKRVRKPKAEPAPAAVAEAAAEMPKPKRVRKPKASTEQAG